MVLETSNTVNNDTVETFAYVENPDIELVCFLNVTKVFICATFQTLLNLAQ